MSATTKEVEAELLPLVSTSENKRYSGLSQPGHTNNPNGRPKGSRNKLSEDFISAFSKVWSKSGHAALEYMAEHEPVKLVQAAVQLLPKDFQVNITADQVSWVINAAPSKQSEAEWRKANNL